MLCSLRALEESIEAKFLLLYDTLRVAIDIEQLGFFFLCVVVQ